ncbi:MAG: hypothetical protein DMF72_20335 [Acidobacteria bacterium]|nr:MAG: hypothetical protein DMF72_20335 [Acidobacteriota bacterium]
MKGRDVLNKICAITFSLLALLGFTVHAMTFFGYDPRALSLGLWYGLQFSSALALIVALVTFGENRRINLLPPSGSLKKLVALCFFIFIVYCVFNFLFTEFVLLEGGKPQIANGNYAIGSHGFLTTISKEEFMRAMVYEARLYSGHWMAFFFFAVMALHSKSTSLPSKSHG